MDTKRGAKPMHRSYYDGIETMELITPRDIIENVLLTHFSPRLKPLTEEAVKDINAAKDGNYGFSFLGLSLYANGHNIHSKSTNCPRGMLYTDKGGNAFGVGVFFKNGRPDVPWVHIIAPRGPNWKEAVDTFSDQVLELLPNAELIIRHLSEGECKALAPETNLGRIVRRVETEAQYAGKDAYFPAPGNASRWTDIYAKPWHEEAPQEDETYTHAVVDLDKVISSPEKGIFRNIEWLGSANSRNMKRRNANGFKNFLEREGLTFTLEEYTPDMQDMARSVVQNHFKSLEGEAIGSTAADYENIIGTPPDIMKEAGIRMYVGFVSDGKGNKLPVSFFGLEETAPGRIAAYATITSYDFTPIRDRGMAESDKGFNNIAAYAMGRLMHRVKNEGYHVFDLGGSETPKLDKGKENYGAMIEPKHWLAHKGTGWAADAIRKIGNQKTIA